MAREIHDHYFRQAKREGYVSRAAYKLIEIDDRKKILKPGARVLDCGAAPGGWLQVASRRIGPSGLAVGIDLKPITHQFPRANVRTLQGDLREIPASSLLPEPCPPEAGPDELREEGPGFLNDRPPLFTVILSDMAPSTTGDQNIDHHQSVRLCQTLLDRCRDLLADEGNLVMKVFEGEAYPDLLARCQRLFESAKGFRPKASRGESREMYIIAHGYRGRDVEPPPDEAAPPPRRRPAPGWGKR
ncbi:MAG: RlmE family RNA methyltransferase [Planctomycetota bacterium]|nr:RlmE family RNA methyltransferase [Planctomycetota bacterium]